MTTATIRFEATKLLHTAHGPQLFDVSFEVEQGRLLAIYGPSGAGKTTLLRIFAGLTAAESGHIRMGDETWLDTGHQVDLPTRRRSIGFVFQDFALFPHLTVRQQLEFALPKHADDAIVTELLQLMELEELQHRRPALLSGGQQQRIAIARAIARRPRLLLLDEPLSALDDDMRRKLQDYLIRIQQHYSLTILLVSHYLPEIIRLADTVICLDKGRVVKQGRPAGIFGATAAGSPSDSTLTTAGTCADSGYTPFHITGTILDLTPSGDAFLARISTGNAVISLTIPPARAAALRPGQDVTLSAHQNFLTLHV